MTGPRLHELLRHSARLDPAATAVVDGGHGASVSYGELDSRSDHLAELLVEHGVRPGDRVVILAHKSIATVTAIFAALKAGAAYVPLDPHAPGARNAKIIAGCGAAALVGERSLVAGLPPGTLDQAAVPLDDLPGSGGEVALFRPATVEASADESRPDLAYLLYTSGSTGEPKGVVHTHGSALAFVEWAVGAFGPGPGDRFASHAPFHFDLSIFDLFASVARGSTLVLFDEALGRYPTALAEAIDRHRITIWYSTPSTLRMLMAYGKMERFSYGSLRLALYAGEVFAANQVRDLAAIWTGARFANLYGPTETNVCTWYELPAELDPERVDPHPIGVCCSGDLGIVVDAEGQLVGSGEVGELCIRGGSVMVGYWRQPERTAGAFLRHADGELWYRTGDLVREEDDGNYAFLGRRDRMVKRLGYRIELGDIESALVTHHDVVEAAVVAWPDDDQGVQIKAYVTTSEGRHISLVQFKRFCAGRLPRYMIPDRFEIVGSIPKTSTDKVDYRTLEARR